MASHTPVPPPNTSGPPDPSQLDPDDEAISKTMPAVGGPAGAPAPDRSTPPERPAAPGDGPAWAGALPPALAGCAPHLVQIAVPFAVTAGALLIGIVIGALGGWGLKPKPTVEYRPAASLAQLHEQCDPLLAELQAQLATVVGEIELVKGQLALKESELLLLEPLALAQGESETSPDGRDYRAELAASQQQASEFSSQLRWLERVRTGLVDQLTRVRERMLIEDERLAQQIAISDLLRDERGRLRDPQILAAWFAFVTDTQTRVCGPLGGGPSADPAVPRGLSRRSLDCRAAVQRELPSIKEDFVRCLRKGAPQPVALRLEEAEPPPPFSHPLDTSNELVAGWVFTACAPDAPR